MRKQMTWVAGALALFVGAGVAGAQESSPSPRSMPQGSEAMPEGACPPGTSPVYQTPGQPSGQMQGQMPGQMPGQVMAPGSSTTTTVIVPGAPGYVEPERERTRPKWSPGQVSLSVGGGVADFVRTRLNDRTSTAGTWDAKLTVGTRSYAAFEASYQGTTQATDDVLTGNDGSITSTQVAGSLRLNATKARFQPFVTAGAGWANLRRTGDPDTVTISIDRSKNAFEAPFGAGFTGYLGRHTLLEARGQYNLIAAKGFTSANVRPDMWSAELRFGYAF